MNIQESVEPSYLLQVLRYLRASFEPKSYRTYSVSVVASSVGANKHHLVLFNGTGSGLILEIKRVIISMETTGAITGYPMGYRLIRTTTAGTGGTALTINRMDTADQTLPTQVTAVTNPTTAPTLSTTVAVATLNPEETGGFTSFVLYNCELDEKPLTLREGEGITIQQYGTAGAGLFNATVIFRARTP